MTLVISVEEKVEIILLSLVVSTVVTLVAPVDSVVTLIDPFDPVFPLVTPVDPAVVPVICCEIWRLITLSVDFPRSSTALILTMKFPAWAELI